MASNRLHAQNLYREGISRRQWLSTSAAATVAAAVGPALCSANGTTAESNLRIWDNHCHLSGIEGDTPAEKMSAMLPYANRMGIERLVIYMGWPFSQDPDSAELIRSWQKFWAQSLPKSKSELFSAATYAEYSPRS